MCYNQVCFRVSTSAFIRRCLLPLQSAAAAGSLKVMLTLDKSGPFCACLASVTTVNVNTFLRKMSANERGRLFFSFFRSFILLSLNFARALEKRLQVQQFSFFSFSSSLSSSDVRKPKGQRSSEMGGAIEAEVTRSYFLLLRRESID